MTALIWTVFADKAQARDVSNTLLSEELIRCANIMGDVESLFIWKGAIESSEEIAVIFKTDESLLEKAVIRVEQLHPYDVPAVMGWKCSEAGSATRAWLGELAQGDDKGDGDRKT